MIDSGAIERAERVLQVASGGRMGEQFERMQVDRDALDKLVAGMVEGVRRHYQIDPRLEPAFNTMCAHAFLVGVVAGRNSEREIV